MAILQAIVAVSSAGPLASRAFLPLFLVCLIGAHPGLITWIPGADPLQVPPELAWLTSPYFVWSVGVLALIEALADKVEPAAEIQDHVMTFIKPAAAVLVALQLVPPELAVAVGAPAEAGWGTSGAAAVTAGGFTWWLARVRGRIRTFWREIDEDDDLSLRGLASLTEDLWAVFGVMVLLIFPILAVFLWAGLLVASLLVRRLLRWREDRLRRACGSCAHPALGMASRCPSCAAPLDPQRVLSFAMMGERDGAQAGPAHPLRLISLGRCPVCAERDQGALDEGCGHCGVQVVDALGGDWYRDYRSAVLGRAWKLVPLAFLLGLIPLLGAPLAALASRMWLLAPLRRFVGGGRRVLVRTGLACISLVLLLLGSLPVVSMVVVPGMVLLQLWIYERLAKRALVTANARAAAG